MSRTEIRSKLSSTSRVVVPKAVREAIGVGPGDLIVFDVREGEIIARRAPEATHDDPFAVFSGWTGPSDAEAHDDL
jgi:AbrB family looped-hinge helix DNA binding protein